MQCKAQQLVSSGIRTSTRSTYSGPQNKFIQFCKYIGVNALPASDNTLLLFITHLHQNKLSLSTIKVYMSSIITMHNIAGLAPPNLKNPQIKLAIRAISYTSPVPTQKSPITFKLLFSIWQIVNRLPQHRCIKAAIALGFFAGLRGAEYLQTRFNPGPTLSQLTFSKNDPNTMSFTVKSSKTKPQGFTVNISCSKHEVCATCAMKDYLSHRQGIAGQGSHHSLFMYNGTVLTKIKLNAILKDLVLCLGLQPNKYTLHSLRSGVATTAATSNFKEWEVKMLGGWATNTYLTYIRPRKHHTKHFARRLTQK